MKTRVIGGLIGLGLFALWALLTVIVKACNAT